MHEAQLLNNSSPNERSSYELYGNSMTTSHDVLMTPNDSDWDNSPVKRHYAQQQVHEIKTGNTNSARTLHWKATTSMVEYLVLGIGFALAHHPYWSSLDGTLVPSDTDQEGSSRYGIAAAFLAQSALTLAVGRPTRRGYGSP